MRHGVWIHPRNMDTIRWIYWFVILCVVFDEYHRVIVHYWRDHTIIEERRAILY